MVMAIMSAAAVSSVMAAKPQDLWSLARTNARRLRISTLITADQVGRMLADERGIQRAIAWCKDHGITRVYVETYRDGVEPDTATLRRARARFRAAGFLVSGCVTPTRIGKQSTGWRVVSCYSDAPTRAEIERIFRRAASLFDEIMIDDFLFTDCACEACVRARGSSTWSDFRCGLMLDVSRKEILGAAKAVNARCRLIIKYPCWHEQFQERGYDVVRQTAAFDRTWVGTETRGGVPGSEWVAEPQYRAYWLMRWLGGIGGTKCGGGWYDWLGTNAEYYLEQARMTVLGGAHEAMLFNFGALMENDLGKRDIAAWREELPLHFDLARLIARRAPRGLLGWKPPGSPAGSDRNFHSLLGMAGFPVIAAHRFDAGARGFVFGEQSLADPGARDAWRTALAARKGVVISSGFAAAVGAVDGGGVVVMPANTNANVFEALAAMPQTQLDALRDRATAALGLRFHAPYGVGLWLFGTDTAVVHSFRDKPALCELALKGWRGFTPVLHLPASERIAMQGASGRRFELPARAMVVLQRSTRAAPLP